MFHLECFRCAACRRHLGQHPHSFICRANIHCTALRSEPFIFPVPGDEFALHGEGIYCKEDHELLERCEDNNNLEPKQLPLGASPRQIKTELEDFRDNLSDLGREEDSYRSVAQMLEYSF